MHLVHLNSVIMSGWQMQNLFPTLLGNPEFYLHSTTDALLTLSHLSWLLTFVNFSVWLGTVSIIILSKHFVTGVFVIHYSLKEKCPQNIKDLYLNVLQPCTNRILLSQRGITLWLLVHSCQQEEKIARYQACI